MKRVLYSLLTLCLLFAGVGVKAEVGDVLKSLDQISNGKVYTIAAPRGGLVLNGAEDDACSSTNASVSQAAGADQWAILKIDGQGYYLYNVAKSQFFHPGVGFSAKPKSNSRVDLMLANTPYDADHVFKFKFGTLTLNNNGNGGFLFDTWSTEDDGNRLIITEAGDFDASEINTWRFTNITFNVVDAEDNILATETIGAVTGDNIVSSLASAFAGVTLETPSTIATDQDQVINTGYTFDESAVPFKYSESFDAATWYTMSVNRPAGKKTATFNGTNFPNVFDAEITNSALFAFVGTPFGYNIYNYAAGADKAVGPTTSEGNPTKLEIVDAAEAAKFLFEYSTEAGYEDFQLFRYADNATAYINDNASFLGVWNSVNNRHDSGSNYIYEEVELVTYAELEALVEEYSDILVGDDPGLYSTESAASLLAAIEAVSEKQISEESEVAVISVAYANIVKAAEGLVRNELTDGEYYIVSAAPGFEQQQGVKKAMYVAQTGDFLRWQTLDRLNENQIFTIKKIEGTDNYTVQNLATGAYVTLPENPYKEDGETLNNSQRVLTAAAPNENAQQQIIYNDTYGEGQFELKSTGYAVSYHPESNSGGSGSAGIIVGWPISYANNPMSAWYIVKVTDEDKANIEQAKNTAALKEAIAEATATLNEYVTYTKGTDGLIAAGATNLSTNAPSLNLAALVNGNLAENLETWSKYPSTSFYLQVDLSEKEDVSALYIDYVPRNSPSYYKTDAPMGWTITASNDGETWDYITYLATDGDALAVQETYTYPAVNLGEAYKYVRFTAPAPIRGNNRDVPDTHIAFAEFQLYAATRDAIEDETLAAAVEEMESKIAAAQEKANSNTASKSDANDLYLEIKDVIIGLSDGQPATKISEGWYAIVSAGNGPGYSGGPYNDENKFALYNDNGIVQWKAYDKEDYTEYYYFTPDGNGNWFAKNLIDETYINRGVGAYSCNVTTSTEATTAQIFEPMSGVEGKWTARFDGNSYVYALNGGHNGAAGSETGTLNIWGTAAEAVNSYKMNVWYLYPITTEEVAAGIAKEKERIAATLDEIIAEYEDTEFDAQDLPGYHVADNVAAFNDAIEAAKAATEGSVDEKYEAVKALKEAYTKATTEFVPITDGYYYLVNNWTGYEDLFGAPAAMYAVPGQVVSGTDKHIVRFEKFDENNANYIFKLTAKEGVENGFDALSVYTNYYLNTGAGDSWYGELTTISTEPENAQIFHNYGVGKFWVADETDDRVSRVIRTTGVQNGTVYGWTTIADVVPDEQLGYNSWRLIPVAADKIDSLINAQNIADAAKNEALKALNDYVEANAEKIEAALGDDSTLDEETKAALEAAKAAYDAVKAAQSYDILTTADDINAIKDSIESIIEAGGEDDIIKDYWQIAEEPAAEFETGKSYVLKNAYKNVYLSTNGGIVSTVDVLSDAEVWSIEPSANDAVASYILKSVAADGYWQYVNYGDQTWDETTPYDGYDWYDYAGLNAELGSAATAQEFTILPAQAGVEGSDAKDAVAAGAKVVENSFVLAAVEQIMGNWFKLGMQGTDAALEPWNEDVAWLFYEVTPVEDAAGALEIALAAYGQKEMKGGEYPGYYAADAVAEYNQTVANAKEALEGDDAEAQRAATAALIETADKEYEINPIVDGETYFIVSAGNGPGYANGPYNYENRFAFYNEGGVVKLGDYDDTDVKYAYTFTQDADGNWNVKNIANNTYISKSDANYGQDVKTSEGLLYAQQFNLASEGKFSMTWVEERDLVCVYAINGSHNGTETPGNIKVWGTIPEAKQYGVNVWYLIPVSEDMKEKLTAIDGIAGAGEGLGVNAANGGITVSSATAQTVSVVSVSGAVVATQHVNAGETVSIQLVPGVYIVNGQKILVK